MFDLGLDQGNEDRWEAFPVNIMSITQETIIDFR